MERDGAKNNGRQHKPAGSIEEGGAPTRQVLVARGDEMEAVRHVEFVGGKCQPKVSLGEGRD